LDRYRGALVELDERIRSSALDDATLALCATQLRALNDQYLKQQGDTVQQFHEHTDAASPQDELGQRARSAVDDQAIRVVGANSRLDALGAAPSASDACRELSQEIAALVAAGDLLRDALVAAELELDRAEGNDKGQWPNDKGQMTKAK
jgi:hypothetical protein